MITTLYVIAARHIREDLGLHHVSNHSAVLPWHGGYGRLTQEWCRAARLHFATKQDAETLAESLRAPNALWAYWVVPLTDGDDSPECGMPKAPQTWKEQIADFTAAEIIAVLGCPQATAYSWKRSESPRTPPGWLQPIILRELRRSRLQ